jgi:hypothetical protein
MVRDSSKGEGASVPTKPMLPVKSLKDGAHGAKGAAFLPTYAKL